MDSDGSGVTKLTKNSGSGIYDLGDRDPEWSPDGEKIIFTSHKSGNFDIYIMDADGSNVVRLTHNPVEDMHPTWSPDGRKIVFSSGRNGNMEIYMMKTDGSNLTNVTNNPATDWCPAWCCPLHGEEPPLSIDLHILVIIILAAVILITIYFGQRNKGD